MITLHASFIEWIFVGTTIMLCAYTIFALRDAMVDNAFLMANGMNGARSIVAEQSIREEALKLGISVVMICVSVPSLFLQPPPPPYALVPQSLVATMGWCAVAMMMVLSSALSRGARRRLQSMAPVEVKKTVTVIPPGESKQDTAADVQEARNHFHLRADERRADRRS